VGQNAGWLTFGARIAEGSLDALVIVVLGWADLGGDFRLAARARTGKVQNRLAPDRLIPCALGRRSANCFVSD
jgi:hypothetical protein